MILRVLLDSNVWRYLADAGSWAAVAATCRKRDLKVQVAPSVVYEALRTSDPLLRRSLTTLLTQSCWARLMPEAYDEAREFESEAIRLHPNWIRSGRCPLWEANMRDWQPSGDFWRRVRRTPDLVASHLIELGDDTGLDSARRAADRERSTGRDVRLKFDRINVAGNTVRFAKSIDGWDGDDVASWRAEGLMYARDNFGVPPFSDWLAERVDLKAAHFPFGRDWVRFWLYGVAAKHMSRWWIRSAWQLFQRARKVTSGTPCDGQLSTYLYDCDVFLTSDKVLGEILERCRMETPAPMGRIRVISVDEALRLPDLLDGLRREVAAG